MIDRDDLRLRLVTTLVPMLFAVATFSATVMTVLPFTPKKTIIDKLFTALEAFCVFTAATLMDSHCEFGHASLSLVAGRDPK